MVLLGHLQMSHFFTLISCLFRAWERNFVSNKDTKHRRIFTLFLAHPKYYSCLLLLSLNLSRKWKEYSTIFKQQQPRCVCCVHEQEERFFVLGYVESFKSHLNSPLVAVLYVAA